MCTHTGMHTPLQIATHTLYTCTSKLKGPPKIHTDTHTCTHTGTCLTLVHTDPHTHTHTRAHTSSSTEQTPEGCLGRQSRTGVCHATRVIIPKARRLPANNTAEHSWPEISSPKHPRHVPASVSHPSGFHPPAAPCWRSPRSRRHQYRQTPWPGAWHSPFSRDPLSMESKGRGHWLFRAGVLYKRLWGIRIQAGDEGRTLRMTCPYRVLRGTAERRGRHGYREKSQIGKRQKKDRNTWRWNLRSPEERRSRRRIRDVTVHRGEKLESSVGPWRCRAALSSVSLCPGCSRAAFLKPGCTHSQARVCIQAHA